MKLGKGIKTIRTQKEMTQIELANRVGLSGSYFSLLERDLRDPKVSTILSICEALGVTFFELFCFSVEDDDVPLPYREQVNILAQSACFEIIKNHKS